MPLLKIVSCVHPPLLKKTPRRLEVCAILKIVFCVHQIPLSLSLSVAQLRSLSPIAPNIPCEISGVILADLMQGAGVIQPRYKIGWST